MRTRYVALLRAVSNVAMQPFRAAMEDLGYSDVSSHGMSGNLLFNSNAESIETLERRIANRFGTEAFVRTRSDLSRVVAHIPFEGSGSVVLFLRRHPTAARRRTFLRLEFESPQPVLWGRSLYYVHPARLVGKRSPFDFEKGLDVVGTARSAGVVVEILRRMSGEGR